LPRGETRQKVEAVLEVRRRTIIAIEESGNDTKGLLSNAVPKLHCVVERLVDVAEKREEVAGAIRVLKTSDDVEHRENQDADLTELENELRAADAEISDTLEELSTLRTRVVRVSIESESTAQNAAAKLDVDLDALNLRLEALRSTMSLPKPPDRYHQSNPRR
jgi:chromosome segregation ATPase